MKENAGVIWIKIAAIYFVVGVCFGLYMAITHNFTLRPVHVHINLLGWVSMGLIGLIYTKFPDISNNGLAKTQFWLHNLGFPVQMFALGSFVLGNASIEPILGIASIVVGFSVILFCYNVVKNLKG
jgi:hypothetical protein